MPPLSTLRRLDRYRPDRRQTLLLKTALCEPGVAAAAWAEWNSLTSLDKATSAEVRLLARAGEQVARFSPGSTVLARLKGARRYTFTRTQVTLAAVRPLVEALGAAGVRMMLIKGAAHVAQRPAAAAERTLRDVDLLIAHADLPTAFRVVEASGWAPKARNIWQQDGGLGDWFAAAHGVGLATPVSGASGSLDLHFFVAPMSRNVDDDAGIWARAEARTYLGAPLFVPSATDSAMIALTHAPLYGKGHKTSDWALDVADAIDAGQVDWDVLVAEVLRRKTEAFVLASLRFLAMELGRPVPPEVMDRLAAPLDVARLAELDYLATGYFSHARNLHHVRAARRMAVTRAAAATRGAQLPLLARPRPDDAPVRVPELARGKLAIIPLPPAAGRRDVSLQITFLPDGHWGRSSLLVRCPGLILDVWRRDAPLSLFASLRRRRLVVDLPAALLAGRHIEVIGLQAGSRNGVRDISLRWIVPEAP